MPSTALCGRASFRFVSFRFALLLFYFCALAAIAGRMLPECWSLLVPTCSPTSTTTPTTTIVCWWCTRSLRFQSPVVVRDVVPWSTPQSDAGG